MDRYLSIEAFVTAAETENFSEAARRLNVSKSVVTTRIQQLENYVGAPLFHRNTRNIQLSEVGEAFLADCTDLLSRTSDLVDQMRQAREERLPDACAFMPCRGWYWAIWQAICANFRIFTPALSLT